jgi:hypothetical protein
VGPEDREGETAPRREMALLERAQQQNSQLQRLIDRTVEMIARSRELLPRLSPAGRCERNR